MISTLTKHQFLCSNTPVIYFHFFMMYLLITVTYTHTPLAIVTISLEQQQKKRLAHTLQIRCVKLCTI